MEYHIVLYVNAFMKDFLNGKGKRTLRNKKEVISFCNKCRQAFNMDRNSIFCPHQSFPLNKLCVKHSRTNCSNLECQTNLLEAKFPQEKRM